MGMKDNFWQMGDTGPCGPCSELHYDMGIAASDAGHTDCQFGCECGRYVEIWNLVFMQFDKQPDGEMRPLPKPSIDTGAGLERVTAVMQGVISNYDTDLFVPLITRAAELTGTSLETETKKEDVEQSHKQAASLRVIADHARASTFLISDGVLPSNEGRGYVLRKIIRRAIRHGRLLGQDKPFLFEMVFAVRDLMKDAYPDLIESANRVAQMIKVEETRFAHTLDVGLRRLNDDLASVWLRYFDQFETILAEAYEQGPGPIRYMLSKSAKEHSAAPLAISYGKHRITIGRSETKQATTDEWRQIRTLEHPKGGRIFELAAKDYFRDILSSMAAGEAPQRIAVEYQPFFGSVALQPVLKEIQIRVKERMKEQPPIYHGENAFRLYDTFGLPRDFMEDACRDQGILFDSTGFDAAMEEQRRRAQASWKGGAKATASMFYQFLPRTEFEGYRQTLSTGCEVLAIIKPVATGIGVHRLEPGEYGEI